jgi:hypothetical protein
MTKRLWGPALITAIFVALAAAAAIGAVGCGSSSSSGSGTSSGAAATTSAAFVATEQEPFRSYEFKPPPGEYSGPFFDLNQDYPTEEPPASERPSFFKTDFRTEWRKYMMEVRTYCLEGNTEAAWLGEKNPVRPWYNMPWQDAGENGREAIHGLTKEAPVKPFQLAPSQTYPEGGAYAVGYYNDFGAYAIGRVWQNHSEPDLPFISEQGFPIGTVVCKPLFVSMPPAVVAEQVPWLRNPVDWNAYTRVTFNKEPRKVQEVALVQMDFMVRDERTSAGWLFGTFQYNGALGHKDRWENLAPVGMMWGNDPEDEGNIPQVNGAGQFPSPPPLTKTPINTELKETVINADASELPATHIGWNGRLNGPVDNFLSSCMSCHMTSSNPEKTLSPLFLPKSARPEPGTKAWNEWWMQWFQNVGWKNHKLERFQEAKFSLDFSLQLSAALENFFKQEDGIKPKHLVKR